MKGIDTNLLVRYILQDDLQQSRLATQFIEKQCTEESPGLINGVVLCELVWVLETAYGYLRKDIVTVIEKVLRTRQFFILQAEILWRSLHAYHQDGADFADHYISNLNIANGCEYTVTFDKRAAKLMFFKLLC